jgi:hypothetical protein
MTDASLHRIRAPVSKQKAVLLLARGLSRLNDEEEENLYHVLDRWLEHDGNGSDFFDHWFVEEDPEFDRIVSIAIANRRRIKKPKRTS